MKTKLKELLIMFLVALELFMLVLISAEVQDLKLFITSKLILLALMIVDGVFIGKLMVELEGKEFEN